MLHNTQNTMGKIKIPKRGSHVKFENFHKQLMSPFVAYDNTKAIPKKGCVDGNYSN